MRSTRLAFTSQPACRKKGGDLAVAVAPVLARQRDDVGREPLLVVSPPQRPALRRAMLTERAGRARRPEMFSFRSMCSTHARRRAGPRSFAGADLRFPGRPRLRISLSSVRSATALRSRWFSSSSSFMRRIWSDFRPPYSCRQRWYVTSVTPMDLTASATDVPCAVITSTCRSFATISSGLCLFLGIRSVLPGSMSHTSGRTTSVGADQNSAPMANWLKSMTGSCAM